MSKRSVIWTTFGNDGAAANDDTAQCKLCMKKVKHSGNTKNVYPGLTQMAKQYLRIVATSVPSEHVF